MLLRLSITFWTLLILFLIISFLYSCGRSLIDSCQKFNIVWLLIGDYLNLCKKIMRTIHFAKIDIKIIILFIACQLILYECILLSIVYSLLSLTLTQFELKLPNHTFV